VAESYRGWHIPTEATLKVYGANVQVFEAIIDRQGGVCPVCTKVPNPPKGKPAEYGGRGVFDHEHVRGWKQMTPVQRIQYVRGITCWFCNHSYLGRGITIEKAENVAQYLADYAARKDLL
jgi:hypothetical protein